MKLSLVPQCHPIDAKPAGAQTFTLNLSLPVGRYARIDWGDGNTTKVSGSVSSQDYSNAYAGTGTYPIKMFGDFRFLTRLEIKTVNVDGIIENIAALSGLTYFSCTGSNTISGDIANLPSGLTYFKCFGSNTISGDIANLPSGLTYFGCGGSNATSGDIANLPSGLTIFSCTGSNTTSGDIANLPSGLTTFSCFGSNTISGDIANLPSGLTTFSCGGSNTTSGDIANLLSGLTYFYCTGSNTISGDIANLPSGLTYFYCGGSNTISDYTTPHTWTTKPAIFRIIPVGAGGLSTAEVDNLLIDFDADLVWAVGNVINLTGTNAARSAASDAAVANMVGEGCTVTTN
jgi:hypothetical protein